jgi:MFS family permease
MTETHQQRRLGGLLPERGPGSVLAASSFIASVGLGLYVAGSIVYFVEYVELPADRVGLGLGLGGLFGLVTGPYVGRWVDDVGARKATVLFTLLNAAALVGAGFVTEFVGFAVVAAVMGFATSAETVARTTLVSAVMGREDRVRLSAYLRSVFNAGFTIGIFGAGLAIAVDSAWAYLGMIWGHAAIQLVVAAMYFWLPATPPREREKGVVRREGVWSRALKDVPYLLVGQVSSLTRLSGTVLTVAFPVWVVSNTSAPRASAAWLIGLNTVLVVLLQVRAARAADTLYGAARLQIGALLATALACLVIAGTTNGGALVTVVLLALAVVLLSIGEMWGEGARWCFRYELADQNAQGQYGGVFRLGEIAPRVVGPPLFLWLTSDLETLGWLLIALLMALLVVPARLVTSWAIARHLERVEAPVT